MHPLEDVTDHLVCDSGADVLSSMQILLQIFDHAPPHVSIPVLQLQLEHNPQPQNHNATHNHQHRA